MAEPPVPPGIVDIIKVIAPYLAAGFTEEQLQEYLPVIKGYAKTLQPDQRVALAVYLKEKAPALAELVDKILDPPPPNEAPTLPDPEPDDLTEDEELKIARYTDLQLKEGNTFRAILPTVNRAFGADLELPDLQAIVAAFRVNRANQERRAEVQISTLKVQDLTAELQKERDAHFATKQTAALKYIEYREGIVVKWGASLVGALGLGLAVGRLLR